MEALGWKLDEDPEEVVWWVEGDCWLKVEELDCVGLGWTGPS